MKTTFTVLASNEEVSDVALDLSGVVIAGWAGRNRDAVEDHIKELAEVGVPGPSDVPLFYRTAPYGILQADCLQSLGAESSGEVETVIIQSDDDTYVTVGSDHTDRALETHSVAAAKQICAKPVSRQAWRYADVEPHWDELILRSHVVIGGEQVLFQEGQTSDLVHPRDLIAKFTEGGDRLPPGTVMFGGTLPVIGGIRPADRFEAELEDPVLGRTLKVAYDIQVMPIVS